MARQQAADDVVSGAALLPDQRAGGNDGGDLFDAARRLVRGVRGAKPGNARSGDSRVLESAGQVDLAWRSGGGAGHAGYALAEPASRAGLGRRARANCAATAAGTRALRGASGRA